MVSIEDHEQEEPSTPSEFRRKEKSFSRPFRSENSQLRTAITLVTNIDTFGKKHAKSVGRIYSIFFMELFSLVNQLLIINLTKLAQFLHD